MVIPLLFLWFFVGLFFGFLAACILMALDGEGESAEEEIEEEEGAFSCGARREPVPPKADRLP